MQTKKQMYRNACLSITNKNKTWNNTPRKIFLLWIGFKAINALNENNGLDETNHKNIKQSCKNENK